MNTSLGVLHFTPNDQRKTPPAKARTRAPTTHSTPNVVSESRQEATVLGCRDENPTKRFDFARALKRMSKDRLIGGKMFGKMSSGETPGRGQPGKMWLYCLADHLPSI